MIESTADIDGDYRYSLERRWGKGRGLLFIMLNPSTADATKNDPTIRRCMGFAKQWRHPAVTVANIFAYRATDPELMKKQVDPVGPRNDEAIMKLAENAASIVCAWGNHGTFRKRGDEVKEMLWGRGFVLKTFRLTSKYQPEHPLYQPAIVALKVMVP